MNTIKTGAFDSTANVQTLTLGPYERYRVAGGTDTLAYVSGDAPAIEAVADGASTRLNQASCLPVNGHIREIRNPYSKPITAQILWGGPVRLNETPQINTAQYERLSGLVSYKHSDGAGAGLKRGVMFMSRKNSYRVRAKIQQSMTAAILPLASVGYLANKPGAMLADAAPNAAEAFWLDGTPMPDLVVISGTYTDADAAQWATDASWQRGLVTVGEGTNEVITEVGPNTALILHSDPDDGIEANVRLWDKGHWDSEAR